MDQSRFLPNEQDARVWVIGSRGKSTILAYLRSILGKADRHVPCAEIGPGESVSPGARDIVVVADTLPGEKAYGSALAAAQQARHLVLNAECPAWVRIGRELSGQIYWVSADVRQPALHEHLGRGGDACYARGAELEIASGESSEPVFPLLEIPSLLGGAACHQVRNVAAAASAGLALDLSLEQLAEGLRGVSESCEERLGRGSSCVDQGARLFLDRAPDAVALSAVIGTACALPAERIQLLIGEQSDLDALLWSGEFDRIALAEAYLSPGSGRAEFAQALASRGCLLYTSPSPRDRTRSRMPSSA